MNIDAVTRLGELADLPFIIIGIIRMTYVITDLQIPK
jgi:hypothetical protein